MNEEVKKEVITITFLFAFSGPATSGKTTLVKQVANHLSNMGYNVKVESEKFRETLNKYNISLDEVRKNPNLYLKVEIESIKEQFASEIVSVNSKFDIVLFDRIVLDYILYSVFYLPISKWMEMIKIYSDLIKESLRLFNIVFLCEPVDNKKWNDGFRSENDVRNARFHFEMLKNWVEKEENVKKLVIVKNDSIESRVKFVVNEIEKVILVMK